MVYSLPSNSSEMECSLDLSSDRALCMSVYSIVFALGVPLNCVAFWGLGQLIRSAHFLPIYLLNLTVADLLFLSTMPLWVLYYKHDHRWELGEAACNFSGILFYANMYASIYFMCCIAVDRYLAIVHPLRFHGVRTIKAAVWVSLVGWTGIILCQIPSLFSQLQEKSSQFCYEWFLLTKNDAIMICVAIFGGFLGPAFVLGYCYVAAIRTINHASMEHSETKWLNFLLVAGLLTFLCFFGPYSLMSLYKALSTLIHGPSCNFETSTFMYYKVSMVLMSLNAVLDPILYILVCEEARKRIKESCF
uniref:G-protein coupled receptors family 1 profile domain-containing protein n=1 Tax=Latimeria chalumnae TaxID=7897 RepID=H3AVB3_LATCH